MAYEIQADYPAGSVLYAIIRSPSGQVWRPLGRVFEEWGAGGHGIADYDIPLTDRSGGRHVGNFDSIIAKGRYCIQVFRQAGGSPADADPLIESDQLAHVHRQV